MVGFGDEMFPAVRLWDGNDITKRSTSVQIQKSSVNPNNVK